MTLPVPPERIAIKRMLHTIHIVRDVAAARKLYQDSFGALAFAERYHPGEDRDMALLYAGDHMIEPMAPRRAEPADTTTSRYLQKYGESLHSFELQIADAPAAAQICTAHELELSTVYPTFFFVKPRSTGGVVVELCGKSLRNDPFDYSGWNPRWFEGHASSLRGLHHIACVVSDMAAAEKFFLTVMAGTKLSDARINCPQPARQLNVMLGDALVALIAADDPHSGTIGAYFSRPVSGVYALVWQVDDPAAARRHFEEAGLKLTAATLPGCDFAIDPDDMMGARHEFIAASAA